MGASWFVSGGQVGVGLLDRLKLGRKCIYQSLKKRLDLAVETRRRHILNSVPFRVLEIS